MIKNIEYANYKNIASLIFIIFTLQGCTGHVVSNTPIVYVPVPSNLLTPPCVPVEAGDTLSSLAQGYVSNTGCIGEYSIRLKKLAEWDKDQREIYKIK